MHGMASPAIFTQTPIEAVIQGAGLAAQTAISGIIIGTPAFWGAAMVVLMLAVAQNLAWMGLGQLPASKATWNLFKTYTLIMIGFWLIGYQTSEAVVVGPLQARDKSWESLPGVSETQAYQELGDPKPALLGFHLINGAMEEISALLFSAVEATLTDSAFASPSNQIRTTMEQELVRGRSWIDIEDARKAVGDYIHRFHNQERRQSKLGQMSPVRFENINQTANGQVA